MSVGTMTRRTDVAVKIDAEVVRQAKVVAAFRGISLAEYLSETSRPAVQRDYREESRKAAGDNEPPKPPKPEGPRRTK
jgi:hypothetical protein